MGRAGPSEFAAVEFHGTRAGPAWLVEHFADGERLAREQNTHTIWLSSEIKILKRLAKPRPIEAIAAVKRVFPGSWLIDGWRVGKTARPSRGWRKDTPPVEFTDNSED